MGQLGPFSIGDKAGQGAMASVWYGEHASTGHPVAIKVIESTRELENSDVYRFRSELRASARIVHPATLQVYDEGVIEEPDAFGAEHAVKAGCPYIVMEWAPHGTLLERAHQLGWSELKGYLLTLLEALAAAHARGIIHRDIKPANLLFTKRGLVLADFGVAYIGDAESSDRVQRKIVGSPNYMAPEQILCRWRDFGPWTDLYSVGAMTWLLTTGKPPFGGESARDVLAAHLKRPLPGFVPRFAVPVGLEDWIRRMMAKNPRNRYVMAADAAHALRSLGGPSDAHPGSRGTAALKRGPFDQTLLTPFRSLPVLEGALEGQAPKRSVCPSLPEEWRHVGGGSRPTALAGVGQRLFGTPRGSYTGREVERDRLWNALRRAADGRTTGVVVSGEAGVGKSAMVQWLSYRAHELGGANRLWFRHSEESSGLEVVRETLAREFRTRGLPPEARHQRLRILLEGWCGEGLADEVDALLADEQRSSQAGGAVALNSAQERFHVLNRLVDAMVNERPLLIVLDDVQWADFLRSWVEQFFEVCPGLPVLVVMTYRDGESGHSAGATGMLDGLLSKHGLERICLGPLMDDEAASMIQARIRLCDETMDLLNGMTHGNPLYAEQLVSHWIDAGQLTLTPDGYSITKDKVAAGSGGVEGLWTNRLGKLASEYGSVALHALEIGSCLGPRFGLVEWAQVCAVVGMTLDETLLLALQSSELILDEGGGEFSLVHQLLGEALESGSRQGGRWATWNQACGTMLEACSAKAWHRIARHRYEANEFEGAAEAALKDSVYRQNIGEPYVAKEALAFGAWCLRAGRIGFSDVRWGIIRARYSLFARELGQIRAALRHAERGLADLRPDAEAGPYAECLLARGQAIKFYADQNAAIPVLKEAVAVASRLGGTELEFECRRVYASVLRDAGWIKESNVEFFECHRLIGMAWLDEMPTLQRAAIRQKYFLLRSQQSWQSGLSEAAAEYAGIGSKIAEEMGSRSRSAVARLLEGRILLDAGDYEAAIRALQQAADSYQTVRQIGRYSAEGYIGVAMIQLGDYEGGIQKMDAVCVGLESVGRMQSARYGETLKLGGLARLGRWDEWERAFEDLEMLVNSRMYGAIFARICECSLAHLVELGEHERAQRVIRMLHGNYQQQGAPHELARFLGEVEALGIPVDVDSGAP